MAAKYPIHVSLTDSSNISKVDFSNIPFGKVISDHMFVVDYDGKEWVNPRIVPFANMNISPANLALHYGQSIFEGMKATKSNGEPMLLRPEMHARRLNVSAQRMCMPELPEDLFLQGLKMLIDLDRDWIPEADNHALYIRPLMYATDEYFGVASSEKYRFLIFTGPVGPYYPKPVKLWVEEVFTRAAQGGAGEAKCAGNYGASLLPAQRAKKNGYDQVMWMDAVEKKYVQEVGTMNLFFVMDGRVVTPATTGTILRGITRDTFITLLKDWGYTVEDRLISLPEIADAYWRGTLQECFGAGTAAVVSHVSSITWRDRVMDLPPVDEEHRPVGTRLKAFLNDLRMGRVPDEYDWMVSCNNSGVEEFLPADSIVS
ncbi:MAG: branched-chain amino acid aminotransferase [Saprospiraceae bacterium]|nr:branched-chain amino acid aminotransferase [Saprospiraceae bacterium]MCB9343119.1 branched-chain amino acid aminotransferase [Lewinellaceae bacterium]